MQPVLHHVTCLVTVATGARLVKVAHPRRADISRPRRHTRTKPEGIGRRACCPWGWSTTTWPRVAGPPWTLPPGAGRLVGERSLGPASPVSSPRAMGREFTLEVRTAPPSGSPASWTPRPRPLTLERRFVVQDSAAETRRSYAPMARLHRLVQLEAPSRATGAVGDDRRLPRHVRRGHRNRPPTRAGRNPQ